METLYFISIGVLTVITCIFIILYFKQRSSSVPRTVYSELKDQFNLAQSNQKVLEEKASTLQATNEFLTQKLGEKETESIQYQTDISSLKTTLTNRDERITEISQKLRDEKEEKQKYQDQISENNRTMAELSAQNSSLVEQLENQKNSAKQLKEQLQELTNHQMDLKENISRLNAQNETLTEKLQTQKQEVAELQKTAHLQFEKIANRLLDEKSQKFTENNKSNIETLLKPLKEDIQRFKSQVEETHKEDTKQRVSLEERIRNLIEQTNKVSEEANNLATALKGKPQKRGNWGEIILERILEDSGLTKDREYFVQNSLKDKDGNILRPDVQVKLPDDRIILIDSKVSLNAYDSYSSSEDTEEQKIFLMEHLKSTQDHIDQLSAKRYDDLESSLDFTMMFIPIEPAYLLAIQANPDIWEQAYSKRILLVSPTNLIASLKLISDLWKREWQNKNALEIASQGEKLYEKIVGFAKTFEDLGKSIDTSQDRYRKAFNQLTTGRGNMMRQALQLKELGLKSSKRIPENLLPVSVEEDGND